LDVVKEIVRRGIDLKFLLVGDGDMQVEISKAIHRQKLPIEVLGWQHDIEKVLAACNMVIITSDNEGTPLSLIQAGMAGLPVVSTNVGSVPEVVLHNRTGIITDRNVHDIADALERLVCDNSLRKELGDSAKTFTTANFGVSRLVHDHEKLYKELIIDRAKS
jgi:glycosyltransferase involved in cell wall biosynthesis